MRPGIHFRKMQADDFEAFFTLAGNENVMAMITGRALTREEARTKFEDLLRNNSLHASLGSFMVMNEGGTTLLGFAKLEITEEGGSEAELGFMLLPEFWGKGYGRGIADRLMHVAGSIPFLSRAYAIIDPDNAASRSILLGLGFVSQQVGEMDGLPSEILGRRMQ